MQLHDRRWMFIVLFLLPHFTAAKQLPIFYLDTIKVYTGLAEAHASYWVDEAGTLTIEELLRREAQTNFTPVGKGLPNLKQVFWCKWTIQNKLQDPNAVKDWILDLGKGDFIEVYFVDSTQQIIAQQTVGELMPMSKKSLYHKHFIERIPFSLEKDQRLSLYIRLHRISGFPPQLKMELYQRDFYEREDYPMNISLRWMFFGMLFTFFIFGMGVFFATQDHTFLYYAFFILGLGGYLVDAIFNVIGNVLFFREYPCAIMYLVYALVTIMNVCHIMFIRSYLNSKTHFPTWDRIARYVVLANIALLGVAWGIYYLTTDEFFTDKVIIPAIITSYFFLISIVIPIIKKGKGSVENYIILSSTSLFTIAIFINAISIFNGTNLRIIETQLILLAVILVFSIGLAISLAYRFHLHQKEKLKISRLQDLNTMKTQFYQNITHEFRTPLTIIKGITQEIQEELPVQKAPQLLPKLAMIQRSGENLLGLVDSLLRMAKLEKNQLELHLQHADILSYLRYLVNTLAPFAKKQQVQLQCTSPEAQLWMDYDEEKIRQVFHNVLSNAIKFSNPNGTVNVSFHKLQHDKGQKLLIQIKDNGIGIAAAEQALVFDRFYQVPRTLSSPAQGSGIGLALTKELLSLMDGEISLESQINQGTTVSMLIPIQQNLRATQQPHTKAPFSPNETLAPSDQLSSRPPTAYLQADTERPQVLLIEDNPDVLHYLESILRPSYQLFTAQDGQQGIELALEKIPDLIVSDVVMPHKNGYELCQTLKADERTSHIPILLLTAKTTQQDKMEGLQQGADAYLVKPFEKRELQLRLQNLLAHRQQIQKRLLASPQQFKADAPAISDKDRLFLKKITQYIQDNISNENLDVAQIQRSTGMSRPQLYRKLKGLTGLSPGVFRRQIRLQTAYQLLLKKRLSVKEVAFEVGYKYPSHFSKDFKAFFGISPKML